MKRKLLYLFAFLLFAGIISASYYFYSRYQKTNHELSLLKSSARTGSQPDNIKIVNAVSRLFELPQTPPDTIYTIKDKTLLKDQPFFDQAKNDDVLLVYVQIKKAILYRPSTNKIVDVAPVNINPAGPNDVSGAVTGAGIGIIPTVTSAPVKP